MDYKKEIIKMVEEIENIAILNYIYIIVSDMAKENKKDE